MAHAFSDLAARYSHPDRHYHTLEHIANMLDALEGICPAAGTVLSLAAWFHDAVYDSRARDNEERSAELARSVLPGLGVSAAVVAEVVRLILLTKCHQVAATDGPGCALIDADLAILGATSDEYDRYAAAIRREYA